MNPVINKKNLKIQGARIARPCTLGQPLLKFFIYSSSSLSIQTILQSAPAVRGPKS